MISSVLCPFLPALEGVLIPGFNQLLLLFLGMQFSTRSESLCSIEILSFTARAAQIASLSLTSYTSKSFGAWPLPAAVSMVSPPASSPCACRWGRERGAAL